jgi:hypothetical protein
MKLCGNSISDLFIKILDIFNVLKPGCVIHLKKLCDSVDRDV